jgi:AcrR family transcriptional regulator
MSAEEIANNRIHLISTAIEMIREGGIQSVTARSLGSRAGINSALIYRYFKDIDELILFSCVHVLQDYASEMTASLKKLEAEGHVTDFQLYLHSWELFSRHAFTYPEEYNILFFSKHSSELQRVSKEYFDLFPVQLSNDDDMILQGMFRTSNLHNRNLLLLIPILEGKIPEDDIILINDMTVAFFYALLLQIMRKEPGITIELQINRMLQACRKITTL